MKISQLLLYPVKSLGAISVSEAVVETRGFCHDRRFMLVQPVTDENGLAGGLMMTQREHTGMALIDVAFGDTDTIRIWHRSTPDDGLTVPLTPARTGEALVVNVWDSADFVAQTVSAEADAWFSRVLQTPCHLVYMPDTTERAITSRYRQPDNQSPAPVVSFADGFPYLTASLESLAELNRRLDEPVEMNRFRPNIVIEGANEPHDEDTWAHFRVGELDFYSVKPCVRCVMTTIDPQTAQKGKEPLKTLATYRRVDNKILFGQNVMAGGEGVVRVGDRIEVLKRMETWI
ncbi:MAG: MOSC domain-containing protein [Rudanella sp.]|nr:MOSC domain-containing protein [Rudanella sp.]